MTSQLARDIAALPDEAYTRFWRLLRRELDAMCDHYGEDDGIARFQDAHDRRATQQETRR